MCIYHMYTHKSAYIHTYTYITHPDRPWLGEAQGRHLPPQRMHPHHELGHVGAVMVIEIVVDWLIMCVNFLLFFFNVGTVVWWIG